MRTPAADHAERTAPQPTAREHERDDHGPDPTGGEHEPEVGRRPAERTPDDEREEDVDGAEEEEARERPAAPSTIASAVGVSDSSYICQAIATR
jgi:hypothetical protein